MELGEERFQQGQF